jgi:hypothetical protein
MCVNRPQPDSKPSRAAAGWGETGESFQRKRNAPHERRCSWRQPRDRCVRAPEPRLPSLSSSAHYSDHRADPDVCGILWNGVDNAKSANRSELEREALREHLKRLEVRSNEEYDRQGYARHPQTPDEISDWGRRHGRGNNTRRPLPFCFLLAKAASGPDFSGAVEAQIKSLGSRVCVRTS